MERLLIDFFISLKLQQKPVFYSICHNLIMYYFVIGANFLLKIIADKFTNNLEPIFPIFRFSEPTQEGFLSKSSFCVPIKDAKTDMATEVRHRDVGTEMTPTGSLTTSRCHTPFQRSSPPRHNTPADRSGPLVAPSTSIDISKFKDCHFAKLEFGAHLNSAVWSSREEEEDEISKSLRHGVVGGERKSFAESRASAWEDEEVDKICIRWVDDLKLERLALFFYLIKFSSNFKLICCVI